MQGTAVLRSVDPELGIYRIIAHHHRFFHISTYMIDDLHGLPVATRIRCEQELVVFIPQWGWAPMYPCDLICRLCLSSPPFKLFLCLS